MAGASPIEQLLETINPPLRPLAQYNIDRIQSGKPQLSGLQKNLAVQSILTKKPVITHEPDHGILSDIVGLPGNFLRDTSEIAQGFFSPWKWIPSIYHNMETGNVKALLPLIPGYTTAKDVVTGNFHDILTHPVGTTLDVLPYAKPGLKGLANAVYGAEEGANAGEAASRAAKAAEDFKVKRPDLPEITYRIDQKPGYLDPETRQYIPAQDVKTPVFEMGSLKAGDNFVTEPNPHYDPNYVHPVSPAAPSTTASRLNELTSIPGVNKDIAEVLANSETTRPQRLEAAMRAGKPGRTLFNLLPDSISSPEEGIIGKRLTDLKLKQGTARAMNAGNRDFIRVVNDQYIKPLQDIFKDYTLEERKGFATWMENYDEMDPNTHFIDAGGQAHEIPDKWRETMPKVQEVVKNLEKDATGKLSQIWYNGRQYLYHNDSPVVKAQAEIAKLQSGLETARQEAAAARANWLEDMGKEITPKTPVSVQRGETIPRIRYQLFRAKDRIDAEESALTRLYAKREATTSRPTWLKVNSQIEKREARLAALRDSESLLSRREMLHRDLSQSSNAAFHVSPEDYELLQLRHPGEVASGKAYYQKLQKLDEARANLESARKAYDTTLSRNAPATFYPKIQDTVLKKIVEKFRANHPDFLEGQSSFDWELTKQALEQHTLGRSPVEAGLISQPELNKLTREVESTWQELADNGFHPIYLSSVQPDRFSSVLDPNLFRSGALKDEPYAVTARVKDLTPSGIKDPVVGLTAPALAILRQNYLQEFYNSFLSPFIKSDGELNGWLDNELQNARLGPLENGESLTSRRNAIRRTRWAKFSPDNLDPELAALFPKGENLYLPKEVYNTVTQLFSPKSDRLESLSRANIHGMRVFRTAVMGLSAKHLAHIGFGGLSMLMLRGGMDELRPSIIRDAWNMAKNELLPKDLSAGVDFYSAKQLMSGITPEAERAGLTRITAPIATGFGKIQSLEERLSNFERSLSYLSEIERIMGGKESSALSHIENGEVRAALAKGDEAHALELAKRGAIKHANRALVDWDGMLPVERGVVRNIFPFYAFTRHIVKYAMTYPIDYPLRASFIYRLGQITEDEMKNQNLPQSWMYYLTFGPNSTGDVTNVDLRFINPFRSLPDVMEGNGLVNSLNPFLGYALQWAGVDPWTTSAQRYPSIRYNPNTGYVETKRQPFSALGLLSQIIPQVGILGDQGSKSGWEQAGRYAFLPGTPHSDNINLQRARDTLGQLEEVQQVVSNALKTGKTSGLRDYNMVSVPGLDRLVPGSVLADLIDSLPSNGKSPRQNLGIR